MSGKLVFEIHTALEQGTLQPFLTPGDNAKKREIRYQEQALLVLIAERCRQDTHQGQVRRDAMKAVIGDGGSASTVDRRLARLKAVGLIELVKPGHKAPGGQAQAATYRLLRPYVAQHSSRQNGGVSDESLGDAADKLSSKRRGSSRQNGGVSPVALVKKAPFCAHDGEYMTGISNDGDSCSHASGANHTGDKPDVALLGDSQKINYAWTGKNFRLTVDQLAVLEAEFPDRDVLAVAEKFDLGDAVWYSDDQMLPKLCEWLGRDVA